MAEVYEAVAEGIEGFEKKVAIKRVLPHLAENKKFIAMFLDEARLSLHLSHANVVNVFDIGQAGGTYFIVMEYVDGTNLKHLMRMLKERKHILPIEQSVYIIMEVCRGLSYAHGIKDSKGKKLGIVHRDVSPPNILISNQGEVKIVDFGLAKATSQLEKTDPGVVKGKYAYLSPESATGKEVDSRMDIFCAGIVLYELLTGQRLFLGDSDVQTIKNVRAAVVPDMLQYNPNIPHELDQIVRHALAKEPEDRFQTADDFAESLAHFLFTFQLKVTGFDIRRSLDRVVGDPGKDLDKQAIIDKFIEEEIAVFASLDNKMTLRTDLTSRSLAPGPREMSGLGSGMASPPAGMRRDSSQSLPQMYPQSGLHTPPPEPDVYEDDGSEDRQNFFVGLAVTLAIVTIILAVAWALGWIP